MDTIYVCLVILMGHKGPITKHESSHNGPIMHNDLPKEIKGETPTTVTEEN